MAATPKLQSHTAVNLLSYYVYCIDTGCGVDFIQEKSLLDFSRAHLLSESQQDKIFQLAYSFYSHNNVLGKIILIKPDILPAGTSSNFFEMKHPETGEIIETQVLIAGFHNKIKKVMVCTEAWMIYFYRAPLNLDLSRARSINQVRCLSALAGILDASKRVHCVHCKGVEGSDCTCTFGCPKHIHAMCSAHQHCSHCPGTGGKCTCMHGCSPETDSQCHVEHSGSCCDGCKQQPIRGIRFACIDCHDVSLCAQCYYSAVHNNTHCFGCVIREGSKPAVLWPRSKIKEGIDTRSRL